MCHFVQPQFQFEYCMDNIDETWHDNSWHFRLLENEEF